MSEQGVNVSEAGLLRAVRSGAGRDEQTRILDLLRVAAHKAESAAVASRRPAVTGHGRRAAGLRAAIELIETVQPMHVGEEWASVGGGCDSVEIHWYDPADEPDELPVRLVANDNAEAVTACVYLSLDEAEQVFRDGLGLVEKLRRDRADRAVDGQATGGGDR
jgi:hypothetical protein